MKKKQAIRYNFRTNALNRDNNKCKVCNAKPDINELDVHHIIDRNEIINGGYVKENGITLCKNCHLKAEQYHITNGEYCEELYMPDNLFKLINSNSDLAIKKSQKL